MKAKVISSTLLGLALLPFSAGAWSVSGVVSCPQGNSAAGIVVYVQGGGMTTTSANGAYSIELPDTNGTYTVCVDSTTLPAGDTVSDCTTFSVDDVNEYASVDFTLSGPTCSTPPPVGPCWLTGGGTIGQTKTKPDYSYGGVVNPGCSPTAAGGGNWNVVDHVDGLHFKGLNIMVTGCSGVPTKSPKVDVNIIDFQGTGTLTGVGGNSFPQTAVCFVGRAIDKSEPGAGKDALYLRVYDCATGTVLMLISTDTANPLDVAPVAIRTGNLQIHTTGCGK